MALFPLTRADFSSPGENEAISSLWACDNENLYLAVDVSGPIDTTRNRAWRHGDGMLLTMSHEVDSEPVGNFMCIGIAGTTKKPQILVVNRKGQWFPKVDCSAVRYKLSNAGEMNRFQVSIPWAILQPIRPLLYETIAINLTFIRHLPQGRTFHQLCLDQEFDTEITDLRRVLPAAISVKDLSKPLAQSFLTNNRWQGDSPIQVNLGMHNPMACPAQLEVAIKEDSRILEKHSSTVELATGSHRWTLKWSPQRPLPTGEYTLELIGKGSGKNYKKEHDFYVLNPEELAFVRNELMKLEENINCVYPGAVHTALANLEWLEQDLGDVGWNPLDLSGYFTARAMLRGLLDGENPMSDKPGLSRRAFRSIIDNSLQTYSLYLPRGYTPDRKWPLMMFLHGSGVDEQKIASTPELHKLADKLGVVMLFPRARRSSGFYLDQDEQEILHNLDVVKKRFPIDWDKLFLGGFSMGGFGTWHTGLRHPNTFAGLAIISGVTGIPFMGWDAKPGYSFTPSDYAENAKKLPLLVVHGTGDTSIPLDLVQAVVTALKQKGVKPRYKEIAGAGHGGYDWYTEIASWLKPLLKK
jgi:predicted esterase